MVAAVEQRDVGERPGLAEGERFSARNTASAAGPDRAGIDHRATTCRPTVVRWATTSATPDSTALYLAAAATPTAAPATT